MKTDLFLLDVLAFPLEILPPLKRLYWRSVYDLLASIVDKNSWTFMNYGFAYLLGANEPSLAPQDEKDRYSAQLFHHVVSSVPVKGRDILEVGCGRGGGCSYVTRYFRPRSMLGVDISRSAISFCLRSHIDKRLEFIHGDAQQLPLSPSTFDAAISVESSHCYPSMERFLAEVHRVLKPKGHLLFADLRKQREIPTLNPLFLSAGFRILKDEDITRNVLVALRRDSKRKQDLIHEQVPRFLQGFMMQFAALEGTMLFNSLVQGRSQYVHYVLQKA